MKVIVNNLEKEEVIDWNKVQLVISLGGIIVQVTKDQSNSNHDDDEFTGVDLYSGEYSQTWNTQGFKPFQGSITLQND